MPLNTLQLESDLINATVQSRKKNTVDEALYEYAQLMAKALEKFVKSGDVNTAGSSTNQTGKVT